MILAQDRPLFKSSLKLRIPTTPLRSVWLSKRSCWRRMHPMEPGWGKWLLSIPTPVTQEILCKWDACSNISELLSGTCYAKANCVCPQVQGGEWSCRLGDSGSPHRRHHNSQDTWQRVSSCCRRRLHHLTERSGWWWDWRFLRSSKDLT